MSYLSYLRVFSSFAVILLHASGFFVKDFQKYPFDIWQASNLLDSSVRFCVPIFLMVTGSLLLQKDEDLWFFLKKRYKRVLIPFLFWATIYILFKIDYESFSLNIETAKTMASYYLKPVSFHFWYVYLILGIYLFIPIIRKWTVKQNKKELLFYLAIWVITLLINKKTKMFFPEIDLTYFTGSLGYLILGYYASLFINFKNKNQGLIIALILFFTGFLSVYYLTEIYTIKYNRFFYFFYESPLVVFSCLGVFLFFKNLNLKKNSMISVTDSCSYGIYLVHILILNFLMNYLKAYQSTGFFSQLIFLLLLSLTVFIISFLIIYSLKQIKFLEKIIT